MVAHKIVLRQDWIYELCVEQARVPGKLPVRAKRQPSHQVVFLRVAQQYVRQSRPSCFMRLKHLVGHSDESCFQYLGKDQVSPRHSFTTGQTRPLIDFRVVNMLFMLNCRYALNSRLCRNKKIKISSVSTD